MVLLQASKTNLNDKTFVLSLLPSELSIDINSLPLIKLLISFKSFEVIVNEPTLDRRSLHYVFNEWEFSMNCGTVENIRCSTLCKTDTQILGCRSIRRRRAHSETWNSHFLTRNAWLVWVDNFTINTQTNTKQGVTWHSPTSSGSK